MCPSEKMLITVEILKVSPGDSSHILSKGPESHTYMEASLYLQEGQGTALLNYAPVVVLMSKSPSGVVPLGSHG